MATDKPDLRRIWAEGAPPANIVDPDVQEPGKFNSGWTAEVPPFEYFNFLQQLFTQGLAHINERGVAVWDTDTTYPIGAVVTGSDGNRYIATSEQDGNNPVGNTNGIWIPFALASNPNIIPTNSKINPIVVVDGTTIPAGTEVSTGWFAQTDLINPTYVDSKWNANSGIIYRDIVIEEGLEFYSAADLVSSIADETRNPRKLGISVDLAVLPGFVRVLVDFASANEVFSAKVEVGKLPSLHNVIDVSSTSGDRSTSIPLNNSWNGYFRRSQEDLPSPSGFPASSGSGGTNYSSGDEYTYGWSVENPGTTVSIDDDGKIFDDNVQLSIQLDIASDIVPSDLIFYIRDNLDNEYWYKDGDTGISANIDINNLLTVTLTPDLLTSGMVGSKLKWFFTLEEENKVIELNGDQVINVIQSELLTLRQWKDVKASRSEGVTYTNSSPVPISVSVVAAGTGTHELLVDGIIVSGSSSGVYAEVPPGSQYVLNLPTSMLYWTELSL